jgi:Cof subfamily protein (haloacid dehalogenase superfamily)
MSYNSISNVNPGKRTLMDIERRRPIELIAIDMDGTLLSPNHTISPRVKAAIGAAMARGVKLVLASGRPVAGLVPYLNELGLHGNDDYCIAFNGAVVQNIGTGERVVEFTLTLEDYLYCADVARELGVHFQGLDGERMYTPDRDISVYTVADSHLTHTPLSYRPVTDMPAGLRFPKLMMIDQADVLDAAIARLPNEMSARFATLKSSATFLDIFDKRAGKGPSLKTLADQLGIHRDAVMALGDHENDIAMLEFAGTSVAMGNAIPAVKQAARYETATNAEDGVARAIEMLVLA